MGNPAPTNEGWKAAVKHYVGIDVSLELSSVCIVDATGTIVLCAIPNNLETCP